MMCVFATLMIVGCGGGSPDPASPTTESPTVTDSPTAEAQNPAAPAENPAAPPTASAEVPAAPTEPAPTAPAEIPAAPAPPAPTGRAHNGHAHCGWIGADRAVEGRASFVANPTWFDAIHPKWYTLRGDGTIRTYATTDDGEVTQAARANGVKLIPLIDGQSADAIRAAAKNPAAHAAKLVEIVTDRGYDGLELDYEHLWRAEDRAPFVAMVKAVADALHAKGKVVTLALPAQHYDTGASAYDYVALQQIADVLHLMGYDYHFVQGPHAGPLAPLGWIEAVAARVASLGAPQKYVLGVANYGIGSGWFTSTPDALARCGSSYATETNHMASCAYSSLAAGRAPHCMTDRGELWFEDAGSVGEKAAVAKKHGLAGIAYWNLGGEPPGFFDAISAQYQ